MNPVDEARLRTMIEKHFDVVYQALRRLGVPSREMDDCMQQVFLVASRKLPSIAEGTELSFLHQTAVKVASTARRTARRHRTMGEHQDTEPSDPRPAPDELADQKRMLALLDEVLDQLPTELRTVFVLFELQEVPMAQIASMLEIPLGTVSSRLRRAREAFEQLLSSHKTLNTTEDGEQS